MPNNTCPYCETAFFFKTIQHAKPNLAPLTPEQEIRDKLLNLTGESYVLIQNNFCPVCGRNLKNPANMKLIFYRDKNTGNLFSVQRLPKTMTEKEVENRIYAMNNDPNQKLTVEMVETDEYGEFLFKKAEERQIYSAECVQEALNALDNAAEYIRCLRTVEE